VGGLTPGEKLDTRPGKTCRQYREDAHFILTRWLRPDGGKEVSSVRMSNPALHLGPDRPVNKHHDAKEKFHRKAWGGGTIRIRVYSA